MDAAEKIDTKPPSGDLGDAEADARRVQEYRDRTQRLKVKLYNQATLKAQSDYVQNFFETADGTGFIQFNPQKPPSDEVLTRMKQRLERNQKKAGDDSVGDHEGNGDQNQLEGRDDPIVALEPDELKQGSHFTGNANQKSTI